MALYAVLLVCPLVQLGHAGHTMCWAYSATTCRSPYILPPKIMSTTKGDRSRLLFLQVQFTKH